MNTNTSLLRLPNPVLPLHIHLELPDLRLNMSPNRQRGFDSESLFECALRRLQERDYGLGNPIKGFVHSPPNSYFDSNQIDFSVEVQEGLDIFFQIKSSERAAGKCKRRMKRLGRFIMVIAVDARERIERVVYKIVKCIKIALNAIQRRIQKKIAAEHRRQKPQWERRYSRFYSPRMCH